MVYDLLFYFCFKLREPKKLLYLANMVKDYSNPIEIDKIKTALEKYSTFGSDIKSSSALDSLSEFDFQGRFCEAKFKEEEDTDKESDSKSVVLSFSQGVRMVKLIFDTVFASRGAVAEFDFDNLKTDKDSDKAFEYPKYQLLKCLFLYESHAKCLVDSNQDLQMAPETFKMGVNKLNRQNITVIRHSVDFCQSVDQKANIHQVADKIENYLKAQNRQKESYLKELVEAQQKVTQKNLSSLTVEEYCQSKVSPVFGDLKNLGEFGFSSYNLADVFEEEYHNQHFEYFVEAFFKENQYLSLKYPERFINFYQKSEGLVKLSKNLVQSILSTYSKKKMFRSSYHGLCQFFDNSTPKLLDVIEKIIWPLSGLPERFKVPDLPHYRSRIFGGNPAYHSFTNIILLEAQEELPEISKRDPKTLYVQTDIHPENIDQSTYKIHLNHSTQWGTLDTSEKRNQAQKRLFKELIILKDDLSFHYILNHINLETVFRPADLKDILENPKPALNPLNSRVLEKRINFCSTRLFGFRNFTSRADDGSSYNRDMVEWQRELNSLRDRLKSVCFDILTGENSLPIKESNFSKDASKNNQKSCETIPQKDDNIPGLISLLKYLGVEESLQNEIYFSGFIHMCDTSQTVEEEVISALPVFDWHKCMQANNRPEEGYFGGEGPDLLGEAPKKSPDLPALLEKRIPSAFIEIMHCSSDWYRLFYFGQLDSVGQPSGVGVMLKVNTDKYKYSLLNGFFDPSAEDKFEPLPCYSLNIQCGGARFCDEQGKSKWV